MVGSRALNAKARASAQRQFTSLVRKLNDQLGKDLASRFVVTIGDEFQALLRHTAPIPDLIWTVEEYQARDIRLGLGYGTLHTPLQPIALNIDGPVLHAARAAVTLAQRGRMLGGVFSGFGEYDEVLTGFAQVLRQMRARWTDRQREVVGLLRQGKSQAEVAVQLRITRQAVSERALSAGWDAYRYAEVGWHRALRLATASK